jgi:CheY-like chemotaxis protein
MEDGGHIAITARCERAVETEAARSDCRGLRVAIAVRDEGCGMGEGELARATDPFFTTKRARGGSGLGLAMVEGFVAQSGGVLRIESEEACGTVVTLVLPIMDAPEEAAPALEGQVVAVQAAHVTEFAPPATEKRPARLTILVVDDNALLLSATARLLQTLNHEVLTALDAQEAFTLVEHNERVSVVLSDVSMPGETGVGLAARLALLRPDLPVILMTGFAGDAIDATDRYVLGKPFTRRQLVSALEAAVPDRG